MNIIGIDHGFGLTKTTNCVFASGVVESENVPFTKTGVVKLGNRYYICGSGRQSLTKNKTEDENYFILTLAAIAKEIEARNLERNCDVVIAAGLPLTTFGREKEGFEKYLKQRFPLRYEFEGKPYRISVIDVKLFPQGYTAVAYKPDLITKEPSQILVDIGSWTVDCMLINNAIPDASTCRSLEMGVIRCIEETQEEVRRLLGLSITSAQVEQILLERDCTLENEVKDIIRRQGRKYTNNLLKVLEESGFDTKAVPTIMLGGGVGVIRKYIPKNRKVEIISDIHANAKGYEIFAKQVL